jgi:hypothetical protein
VRARRAVAVGLLAAACGADGTLPETRTGQGTDGGVVDRAEPDPRSELEPPVERRRTDVTDGRGGSGAGPSDGAPDDAVGGGVIGTG